MMTENVPNLRGASLPYSLGFVPGLWMQSVQVSKGAASVKNGYESLTGQINIEFVKPQGTDGVRVNVEYYYTDFSNQMVVNYDGAKGAGTVSFENLHGRSYSHTIQLDATYTLLEGLSRQRLSVGTMSGPHTTAH